jgi:hypothetical protein
MAKRSQSQRKSIPESVIASYQVTSSRRLQYENLMWQVPALSLSAQAVLISVTLNSGSSPENRLITSVLSAMVGIISIQLLQKHRYHEVLESKQLEQIENTYDLINIHAPITIRAAILRHKRGKIESLSGFVVWRLALFAFALTGIATSVSALDAVITGRP